MYNLEERHVKVSIEVQLNRCVLSQCVVLEDADGALGIRNSVLAYSLFG